MSSEPNALIVKVEGGEGWHKDSIHHLCMELHSRLSAAEGILLAADRPVELREAFAILSRRRSPIVPVVVGNEARLGEAAASLPLRGGARPILVELERGNVALELVNASQDDIVRLVHAAIEAAEAGPPGHPVLGEILEFRARAAAGEAEPAPPPARATQLPVRAPGETVEVNVRRTLTTVLAWADAATSVLTDLWSSHRGEPLPVYGLSWPDLMQSLDRLLGIADAPMEEARRQYDIVKGMLVHEAAAQTPFVRLAALLRQDEVALKLVMIVIAPELDIRFQRMFGALHEDPARRHVSLGLACAIVAAATADASPRRIRSQVSALATLRDFRIIEEMGDTLPPGDEPLRIDRRLLDWLVTGTESWLTADSGFDPLLRPAPAEAAELVPSARRAEVHDAVRAIGNRSEISALILAGSDPDWIDVEAAVLPGIEMRIGPPGAPMAPETLDTLLRQTIRTSRLLDRPLVVDMSKPGPQDESFWRALLPLLRMCGTPARVIGPDPARLLAMASGEPIAVATVPPVAQAHRVAAIGAILGLKAEPPPPLAAELAERFRIPLASLPDVRPLAWAAAAKARREAPDDEDWRAAFREAAGAELPDLARRIPPRPAEPGERPLRRVVLPERQQRQLETLLAHVKEGGKVLRDWHFGDLLDARGVSALFAGESGTGKTTAAHAIASELGADLYVIDLARVVSKYIGETEKNLDRAFTAAEDAGAVLLFDEADALFGKRSSVKDAHDRYANVEVAYLLQRMELFDGLSILTTNYPKNIDPAFGRRLRFTIDFPFPGLAERERIWKQALPSSSGHLSGEIDFLTAARRLEVTGGSIRQIALHALMAAAREEDGLVRPAHLREAARTELYRLGRHDSLAAIDSLFVPAIGKAA
jgi:hypothetical protein